MTVRRTQITEQTLLEHRDFLRALARKLVFDEHRADDVVQQTWLAALQGAPPSKGRADGGGGPLRSWLARVVKNLAVNVLEREGQRPARESLAARPEAIDEEEQDLELQQLVSQTLRGLRQPYRTTVYLRFYRDLTPARIARLQGVPVATVKTRLRRALELMREELDRSSGGNRASWCLALAPFASAGGPLLPTGSLATAVLEGTILMNKSVLTVTSVVAAAALVSVAWVLQRPDDGRSIPSQVAGAQISAPDSGSLAGGAATLAAPTPEPATSESARKTAEARVVPPSEPVVPSAATRVVGRVLDERGEPVAGAQVRAVPAADDWIAALRLARDDADAGSSTDASGRFELALDEAGTFEVAVGADGFAPYRRQLLVAEDELTDAGTLQLDPGVFVSGRVLDSAGHPVAGVEVHRPIDATAGEVTVLAGLDPSPVVARTDAVGAFSIARQAVGPWRLRFVSPDHPTAEISGTTERAGEHVSDLVVALEDGFEIAGYVSDVPADAARELRVRAAPAGDGGGSPLPGLARFDFASAAVEADGSFRLRGLEGGRDYRLRAVQPGDFFGERARSESVLASPGDRGVRLDYARPAAVVFQVLDAESGAPVTDFDVRAGKDWGSSLRMNAESIGHHPDGRARFDDLDGTGMLGGNGRLRVSAVGYETFESDALSLAQGEERDLGIVYLDPVPVVKVTVLDDALGKPVAGARVRLEREGTDTSPAAPGSEVRMDMRVRATGSGEVVVEREDDGVPSGITDEHGVCTLTSLPGERARVAVQAEGFAPARLGFVTLPLSGDHTSEVRLHEGAVVDVLVLDAEGAPLAGMGVRHRSPSGEDRARERHSDSEGRVLFENLEEGPHGFLLVEDPFTRGGTRMEISGAGPEEHWNELEVLPGVTATLTLHAAPLGALVGVVTESGVPLAGAAVRIVPADEDRARMATMLGSGPSTRTDSRGRYELAGIPVETYELEVSHATRHMPWRAAIDVEAGEERFDVDLPVTIVEGLVTDHRGEPVAGARVSAERDRGQQRGPRMIQMVAVSVGGEGGGSAVSIGPGGATDAEYTDEEGRYALRGVLSDTPLVVKVQSDDSAPARSETFDVAPGAVRERVDVALSPAGSIAVTTRTPDGAPAGGFLALASFAGESAAPIEPVTGFVGPDGRALLRGCAEGKWLVRLNPMGVGDEAPAGAPEPLEVDVVPGKEAPLSFEVP